MAKSKHFRLATVRKCESEKSFSNTFEIHKAPCVEDTTNRPNYMLWNVLLKVEIYF